MAESDATSTGAAPELSQSTQSELVSPEYWKSLREVYATAEDQADWSKERPILEHLLPLVVAKLAPRYSLDIALDKGGAGLISRIVDVQLTKLQEPAAKVVHRVLKLARPVESQQELLNNIIIHEYTTLASLTHTNIIKLYGADYVEAAGVTRPYYIMDYIKDAKKSFEYVAEPATTFDDLVRLVQEILTAVAFLFDKHIVHNDLKPSNILVDEGRAIVSDLGSAINTERPKPEVTIPFTARYAHPDKKEHAVVTRDPNRMRRTLPSAGFLKQWDLYSLGLTVLELLEVYAKSHPGRVPPYEYRYLRLLGSRLLDNRSSDETFRAYGFPKEFYRITKYVDIAEAQDDIQKITGQYFPEKRIPELATFSQSTLQCGMYGPTALTERLRELLRHPAIKRLSSISQLGFLVFLYPGATHTRAEHSLGVYANSARIITALWRDPVNQLFRQIMTEADLSAALLAALVHDVGQYPLAHDLEEANETFFRHEAIGFELMNRKIDGEESLSARIDRLWPTLPGQEKMSSRVLRILKAKARDATYGIKEQILHSIIDGPIDADKLDYLARDSRKLGVTYGSGLDFERLMRVVTVIHETTSGVMVAYLGVHERGKVSAEAVGFARYAMFGSAYLHRTSRAVKSMLHFAVWDMMEAQSDLKSMRTEFQHVIIENRLPAIQQELFGEHRPEGMALAVWPGVNLADEQLVAWLWLNCGPEGRYLLELLSAGTIYERACVIGHDTKEEAELWKNLNKLSRAAASDRIQLDSDLAAGVMEYLSGLSGKDRAKTAAFDDRSLKHMAELKAAGPLVLLDIPVDRTEGMKELRFFCETARWKYDEDDLVKIGVGSSDVWDGLIDSFHKSLGKMRVYVHPEAKATMRAIPAVEWQRIIETSRPH